MQLLTKQTTATYSTLSNVQYWRWQDGSERQRAQWMSAARENDAVIILFTTIKTTNKITKQNCNYIRVFKWKTIMCSWKKLSNIHQKTIDAIWVLTSRQSSTDMPERRACCEHLRKTIQHCLSTIWHRLYHSECVKHEQCHNHENMHNTVVQALVIVLRKQKNLYQVSLCSGCKLYKKQKLALHNQNYKDNIKITLSMSFMWNIVSTVSKMHTCYGIW